MSYRIPIPDRNFNFFLSHATEDKESFAEPLKHWAERADMTVFYDSQSIVGDINDVISEAIGNSRAGVVVWSKRSVESSWVKSEYNCFLEEAKSPDFQIVEMVIEDCKPPMQSDLRRRIDCRQGFGPEQATLLIESLFSDETRPDIFGMRPVYLARGGRPHEAQKSETVSKMLTRFGIRVVRDAPHNDFSRERIGDIMRSCRGMIALVPERPGPGTTPYILAEIAIARAQSLPMMIIVDDSLSGEILSDTMDKAFLSDELFLEERGNSPLLLAAREIQENLNTNCTGKIASVWRKTGEVEDESSLAEAIQQFTEELRAPEKPANCFFGHVYRSERTGSYELAKRCIQSVAGMPCSSGNDFRQDLSADAVQPNILQTIKNATFAVFDITDDDIPQELQESLHTLPANCREFVQTRNWALNTTIEAGAAMGAGIPVYFVAGLPPREPVFMLRNQQIYWYKDDTDLLALLRKICQTHRRITEAFSG
ncbi:MAG: toll/interleukin-1 receptor domain-containing protein [Verrucomicrobiales bacterium]|nr:toll/interleukin-1 receptor domain-containing protein [Verrucomicrobiales bacterium]